MSSQATEMDKPTLDTSVALLQQSITTITATTARIETKLDKMDDASRHYVTVTYVQENYATLEAHNNLVEKFKLIAWGLGIAFVAIVGESIHLLFTYFGGK